MTQLSLELNLEGLVSGYKHKCLWLIEKEGVGGEEKQGIY